MNEDDWNVDQFSTSSGSWTGTVQTYNFQTGGVESLNTRVTGNNTTFVSSDQVFSNSGLRRASADNLRQFTSDGSRTRMVSVGGLRWEFSYGVFNVSSGVRTPA